MPQDESTRSDDCSEPVVVPIEDAIDLHGFRPREVLDVVDAYLDAARERGLREVRLIHGRGKGVQRAQIRRMLDGDPRVQRSEEAPPGRGGWGATLVWLHDLEDAVTARDEVTTDPAKPRRASRPSEIR